MNDKGILIADGDTRLRKEMSDFFYREGYQVETTDSAVHAFCTILGKKTPVLLLGPDFDRKISSVDLVNLLKMCNRHLAIILVSETTLLPQAKRLYDGQIFYHALKPSSSRDHDEVNQVVKCAFENIDRKNRVKRPGSRQE